MILVVDANILIGELLRRRGQELIQDETLQLYVAQSAWEESHHELEKRIGTMVQQGRATPEAGDHLLASARQFVDVHVTLVPGAVYASWENRARRRIPADPSDWETVALALTLDAAIWTHDHDFLGCGCATWTTQTLITEIQGSPPTL